ncbi:MAG: V-type ATP synthase subunit E [Clostridiaceae bacterium]|nr:V-type ATP synthase subunit E [Clostridiaceae bacterium]
MQGIDRIIARIAEEAADEIKRQEENARKQAEEIRNKGKTEADAAYQVRMKDAQAAAEEVKRRTLSMARLSAQKTALATKQAVIAQAFDHAREQLAAMQGAPYESYLISLIERNAEGGETVCFSAKDEKICDKIVKAANERLAKKGITPVINGGVDPKVPDGIILREGLVEQNLTFDAIIRQARPSLTGMVAGILFFEERQ